MRDDICVANIYKCKQVHCMETMATSRNDACERKYLSCLTLIHLHIPKLYVVKNDINALNLTELIGLD